VSAGGLAPHRARQGPGDLPGDAVARVELALRRRMSGVLPGEHPSAGAADGMELVQLRPYEPGDDVRRLDAAASARTGVPHIRLQVPERAVVTWLVADVSASMAFGSRDRLKSDVVEGVAEVVARLAVRRGGRIAVALAGAGSPVELPPASGRAALAAVRGLLRSGVAADGAGEGDGLGAALDRVGRLSRSRAVIVVASDFREAGWAGPLRGLAQRHAILAAEVVDPLEAELPDAGLLTVADPETGALVDVDTSDRRVRAAYADAERERRADVATALRGAGARHLVLSSEGDWLRELGRAAA
jgi:uncharacterized protein (DUF58 family)